MAGFLAGLATLKISGKSSRFGRLCALLCLGMFLGFAALNLVGWTHIKQIPKLKFEIVVNMSSAFVKKEL